MKRSLRDVLFKETVMCDMCVEGKIEHEKFTINCGLYGTEGCYLQRKGEVKP